MEKETKVILSRQRTFNSVGLCASVSVLAWLFAPHQFALKLALSYGSALALFVVLRLGWAHWTGPVSSAFATYICLIVVPPLFLPLAYRNNGWTYGFDILSLSNRAKCDVLAYADELARAPDHFAPEAPHWDADAGRCDCRRPDHGLEDGRCVSPAGCDALPTFTVVTALIDIGRRSRNGCRYLGMLYPHLRRDTNLVMFTEEWAAPFVRRVRETAGLSGKTKVHVLNQSSNMAFYSMLPRLQENADRNYIWHLMTNFASGVAQKTTAGYSWVTHQKFDFMLQAATENAFASDYFVWMDAGGGHGEVSPTRHLCACNLAVPGTATVYHRAKDEESLFKRGADPLNPTHFLSKHFAHSVPLDGLTLESYMWKHWIFHDFQEIMGTFFGGDLVGLRQLVHDYSNMVHAMVDAGHVDYEQAVLSLVAASKPSYMRFISSNFYGVNHLC